MLLSVADYVTSKIGLEMSVYVPLICLFPFAEQYVHNIFLSSFNIFLF